MNPPIDDVIKSAIEHMKRYTIPPQAVDTKRLANAMNNADSSLGVKRQRKWCIGDHYYVVTVHGIPRVVMVD